MTRIDPSSDARVDSRHFMGRLQGWGHGRGRASAGRGRRPAPAADEPRQGHLPRDGHDQGRGDRLLHARSRRSDPARRRPAGDAQALGRRRRHRRAARASRSSRRTSSAVRRTGCTGRRSSTRTGAKDYPLIERRARPSSTSRRSRASSCTCRSGGSTRDGGARQPRPPRARPRSRPGRRARRVRRGRALGARHPRTDMGLEPLPGDERQQGHPPVRGARRRRRRATRSSAVAHELARAIEADHPDLVVSEHDEGPARRAGCSSTGARTTATRRRSRRTRCAAGPRPTVAAPRTWEELDDPDLAHLAFDEVLERAERHGDPMAPLGFHAGGRGARTGRSRRTSPSARPGDTPEPVPVGRRRGDAGRRRARPFVIQEHHATALHWDLRLERDGVLVSWAVPKRRPARRRSATTSRCRPRTTRWSTPTFEGTIPKGEYGAGIDDDLGRRARTSSRSGATTRSSSTLDGQPGGPLGRVRLALIRTDGRGREVAAGCCTA